METIKSLTSLMRQFSTRQDTNMDYQEQMKGCRTIIGVFAVLLLLNSLPLTEAQSDPCKGVNCAQGQCVQDSGTLVGYRCDCNTGWKQIAPMFPFLSCFIPNCTLNFTCDGSPAPPPTPATEAPSDLFPPLTSLSWCIIPEICGSGDCNAIPSTQFGQLPSYTCDCHHGSSNLLNQTTGPCIPDCAVSGSCAALNLPLLPSPPSQNGTDIAPSPSSNEGNSSSCANVDCWKGKCAPAPNLPWLPQYSCNCDQGWLNLLNLSYLACGLPNCEVSDPSCGMLNHPPAFTLPSPQDLLNPCTLSLCGDGKCVSQNTSGILFIKIPSYDCICDEGASNLLNSSSGMCVPNSCIPQCLRGLGWGETQPPTGEDDPFALSPDSTFSATPSRKLEVTLGFTFVILTIFVTQF